MRWVLMGLKKGALGKGSQITPLSWATQPQASSETHLLPFP